MKVGNLNVEYLIVGSITLLALATSFPPETLEAYGEVGWKIIALIPLVYVAGMLIDSFGVVLEEAARRLTGDISMVLRFRTEQTPEGEVSTTVSRTVEIMAWNSAVGEELKARRSRDRIARGTLISLVLLYFVSDPGHATSKPISEALANTVFECEEWRSAFWLISIFVAATMWFLMHRLTRDFKRKAHTLACLQENLDK